MRSARAGVKHAVRRTDTERPREYVYSPDPVRLLGGVGASEGMDGPEFDVLMEIITRDAAKAKVERERAKAEARKKAKAKKAAPAKKAAAKKSAPKPRPTPAPAPAEVQPSA